MRARRHLPHALVVACCAVLLGAVVLPALASQTTTIDLRGTWAAQGQGGGPYTITLTDEDCSTGVISGTASGGIGPENGTLNGSQVTLHESYGGYTSDITGSVSADDQSITGSFHDSNNYSNTWAATRQSGPPATPPPGCAQTTTSTSTTPTQTTPATTPTQTTPTTPTTPTTTTTVPDPCTPPAVCPPKAEAIAQLYGLTGHVFVQRGKQGKSYELRNGDPLFKGDVLVADSSSSAAFELLIGGRVGVRPGAQLLLLDEGTITHPDGTPFVGKYEGVLGAFKFFADSDTRAEQRKFDYIGTPLGAMTIKG